MRLDYFDFTPTNNDEVYNMHPYFMTPKQEQDPDYDISLSTFRRLRPVSEARAIEIAAERRRVFKSCSYPERFAA